MIICNNNIQSQTMSMVNHTTSSPEKPKGKITFLFSFFFFLLIWVLFSLVVFIRHLFDVLIRSTRSRMEIFFAVYFDEFSLKWRRRRGNCLISWLKWIFQFQFELKTPISYQKGGMVMCQLKDCPKIDCENPIRTKDDCCPMCPGAFHFDCFLRFGVLSRWH